MSGALREFGILPAGPVHEISIGDPDALQARVLTWGAVLRDLVLTGRGGRGRHIVLGLNTLPDYLQHSPNFGAIVGRVANRIAHGRFCLDGVVHRAPLNDQGRHSVHGGGDGFGKRVWRLAHHDQASVTLALTSPHGDAGYPGAVEASCTYRVCTPATLRIELSASADRPTPLNLAPHSYFRLDDASDILDHDLQIHADFYTPVDEESIPTGEIRRVAGTPCDFRVARAVRRLDQNGQRVRYDVNFVLRSGCKELVHAATLSSARSGVALEVWTSAPGLQFYDGFKLNVAPPGLNGERYIANAGLCLETQHFPDSPNRPHFPSVVLRPGERYRHICEYRFSTR